MSLPPCPRDDCTARGHHYHYHHTRKPNTGPGFFLCDGRFDDCDDEGTNDATTVTFTRCYSPHVKADTPDPRLHVLERRLPDWPTDDLADLLAELDMEVTR